MPIQCASILGVLKIRKLICSRLPHHRPGQLHRPLPRHRGRRSVCLRWRYSPPQPGHRWPRRSNRGYRGSPADAHHTAHHRPSSYPRCFRNGSRWQRSPVPRSSVHQERASLRFFFFAFMLTNGLLQCPKNYPKFRMSFVCTVADDPLTRSQPSPRSHRPRSAPLLLALATPSFSVVYAFRLPVKGKLSSTPSSASTSALPTSFSRVNRSDLWHSVVTQVKVGSNGSVQVKVPAKCVCPSLQAA